MSFVVYNYIDKCQWLTMILFIKACLLTRSCCAIMSDNTYNMSNVDITVIKNGVKVYTLATMKFKCKILALSIYSDKLQLSCHNLILTVTYTAIPIPL